ncbi:MAG: hypothetical protein FRX48_06822 [Lasallia pustulata]|uniref:Uncharacterized protein n=1 Tax=Lasallia pustulata TaxID=136370 RepID=A0A5M8PIN9_9LECA|nr:MAG: hypothetical protein FRX48_06822 [Lasallia pustulata]
MSASPGGDVSAWCRFQFESMRKASFETAVIVHSSRVIRAATSATTNLDCRAPMPGSSNKIRQSGKSREYVLVVLPQLAWYQLPTNVKRMGFGHVYQDAMLQIGENYRENPQEKELLSCNPKIPHKLRLVA